RLGPDHPDVATTLSALANIYATQNRRDEAAATYRRAIAIYEKAYGPDHPFIATALDNLGRTLQAQQKYDDAAQAFLRALAIRNQALGPNHPDTAFILNDLAALDAKRGWPGSAIGWS